MSRPDAARTPYVAVIGPAAATLSELELAREVGALAAGRGAVIVCGGLGGVMSAASEGASRSGGMAVGLLPGDDRAAANPFLTVAVATGLGELRNPLVVRSADAVVCVGGSWGTLSELAMARRIGKPVVLLGAWTVTAPGGGTEPMGVEARTPAEAVDLAMAYARDPGRFARDVGGGTAQQRP